MATPAATDQGTKKCIVFVDDIPQMVTIVQKMFEQLGLDARCFNNTDEAIAFVCESPESVGLLITDQSMAPVTGLQLIDKIQSCCNPPPAILATSVQSDAAISEYKDRGVSALLRKPFTLHELEQVVIDYAGT
ncbi:MAG: response regulator [Pseudomonadota bacterium]